MSHVTENLAIRTLALRACCMRVMDSQATADAVAFDGVKRETVKLVVFDKPYKI